MRFFLLAGFFFLGSFLFGDCWSSIEKQKIGMAEFDGYTKLSFRSATDCKILNGLDVVLEFKGYKPILITTDEEGNIAIPNGVLEQLEDGSFLLKVSKKGFIPLRQELEVNFGTIKDKYFLLSKKMDPKSARFVLSWGSKPSDLDLHLVSSKYHISYRDKKDIAGVVTLDQDARDGFGAETITLKKIDPQETYHLYVTQYSQDGKLDRHAQITIYLNNKLLKVVHLPKTDKKVVEVLTINNGAVKFTNTPKDAL